MGAEVQEGRVVGKLGGGKVGSGLGDEYLAAVTCRHDAGGPIHDRAEVIIVAGLGVPDVHPHPHPDGSRVPGLLNQGLLGLDAGMDGCGRAWKDRYRSVAGCLQQSSISLPDGLSHDGIMAFQRL